MGWKDTIQKVPAQKSWRDTVQKIPQAPSEAESIGRGLVEGGTFGLEPELAGIGGIAGDKLGRVGVDPVESTHPEVQANLDAIAQARTPSASSIFDKTKGEEMAANDLAQKTNPGGFLAGELLGGYPTAKALLSGAGSLATKAFPGIQDIPVGKTLKAGAELIPGAKGYLSKATDTLSELKAAIQANRAARLGENVVEAGSDAVGPEVREQVMRTIKNKFDPFTKKFR